MARDEDFFRKLKKETPLVKQKALQPLSPRDFSPPRSSYNIPIQSPAEKRSMKRAETVREPGIFSDASERSSYARELRREPVPQPKARRSDAKVKRTQPKQEPEMFSERQKAVQRPAETPRLDVFTDNARPQRAYEHAPAAMREEAAVDISAIEETAPVKAMSLRHELKYYINYRDYILLRSALKSLMSPDPFTGSDNTYYVRSLYFDDINDTALREKVAGSDNRRKYRIRIYNFKDDNIKFEKKYKVGQYIGKETINLSRDEYESIMDRDYDFLKDRDEDLAKELFLEMKSSLLRPRVIVDYVREAYVSPFENCRITFDKDLKGGLMLKDIFDPHAPVMPMYDSGIMVLEVKFNRFLPEYIKRVLNNINAADRCAISKYVICRKFD